MYEGTRSIQLSDIDIPAIVGNCTRMEETSYEHLVLQRDAFSLRNNIEKAIPLYQI